MDNIFWADAKNIKEPVLNEIDLKLNSAFIKFQNLEKQYFQMPEKSDDLYLYLKEISALSNLDIDANLKNVFIKYETAPYFWVYESALVKEIKKYLRLNEIANFKSNSSFSSFIDFYKNWVFIKYPEEKKYFANSLINQVKNKSNKKNFFGQILLATILIYDKSNSNPAKAIEVLKEAETIISGAEIDDSSKFELNHLLRIFCGFAYLKQNKPDIAEFEFSEALNIAPDNLTAKFYQTISKIRQGEAADSSELLLDIFNYDLNRVKFAIEVGRVSLFDTFIKHNFIQNFFSYIEYTPLYNEIDALISEFSLGAGERSEILRRKIIDLRTIASDKTEDVKVFQDIEFILNLIDKYSGLSNLFFWASLDDLQTKFVATVAELIELLSEEKRNYENEKLKQHDEEIKESRAAIIQLEKDLDNVKKRVQKKLESSIRNYENNIKDAMLMLEEKIRRVPMEQGLDPKNSFKTFLTYNFFFSIMILLVVGFASYSNNYISELSDVNNIISAVIMTGSKWGIISFIIGFVFAVVHSFSIVFDKYRVMHSLKEKLNILQKQKSRDISKLKEEAEEYEKIVIDKLRDKINFYTGRIEQLNKEKKEEEDKLREKIEVIIRKETESLRKLLEESA